MPYFDEVRVKHILQNDAISEMSNKLPQADLGLGVNIQANVIHSIQNVIYCLWIDRLNFPKIAVWSKKAA